MIGIVVCAVIIWVLHLVTPLWWWIVAVPFVYGAARARTAGEAIRTGILSAGSVWFLGGAFAWATGSGIIVARVAGSMKVGAPFLVLLATVLVAAIAAGLAGAAGYFTGAAFYRPPSARRFEHRRLNDAIMDTSDRGREKREGSH